jgi:formylglycine-generating enzyme
MSSKRCKQSKPARPQYTLEPAGNRWVLPLVLLGIGAVAGAGIAVAAFGGWRGHAATGVSSQLARSGTSASDSSTPACCLTVPSRFGPATPPGDGPPGMAWVPGGEFSMGSEDPQARPDERPVHRVRVDGFWIEQTPVTNAQFRKFVEATGYVTTAERKPDWEEIKKQVPPGTPRPPDEKLVAASLVFRQSDGPVDLHDFSQWWSWVPGADWRHPHGPGSGIDGLNDHPVVQVSWDDAAAYAKWAGRRLPTEAEFEFAARGGLDGRKYPWGDEPISESHPQCNFWQGQFPNKNTNQDGYARTSPVRTFPANGYGLYDMAGNVWEWCADWYRPDTYAADQAKGVVTNPAGPTSSLDPEEPYTPKRVVRGGSFLCNDSYCASYRAAARMKTSPDSGSDHTGFRCVMSAEAGEKLKPTTRPGP